MKLVATSVRGPAPALVADRLGRFPRITGLLLPAIAVQLIVGCGFPAVTAKHDPLYRASSHTSTISATAKQSEDGISKITIHVTKGTMTDCSSMGGTPSVIPCRSGSVTFTHDCSFPTNPAEATCSYSEDFGNQGMISYHVEAESGAGKKSTSQEITFATGYPPTAWIARPIWWHRADATGAEIPTSEKIDLCFVPDADYSGLYSTFTGDAQKIIDGSFFNSSQQFAKVYTSYRGYFNLWAGPFGADAEGCSRTVNSDLALVIAPMDGTAIVHSNSFRDCATITAGGGKGSVYAGASDSDWILMHESGHFLHGQGDEYCCDGGYANAGSCKNVFSSESDCRSYSSTNGFDPDDCVEIKNATTSTGKWRSDNGQLETMRDRTDDSDWQNMSRACVLARFKNCASGSCY